MGWVTLALRKSSLKQEHSYYQLRLLQISREKRQLARRKSFENQSILNEQRLAEKNLKESMYTGENGAKGIRDAALKDLNKAWNDYRAQQVHGSGSTYEGLSDEQKDDLRSEYSTKTGSLSYSEWESDVWDGDTKADIQADYDDAVLNYQDELNTLKTGYETDLQMLEEEAADEELILDQEQIEVETQMEAISQEIQAVSDAVSTEIQNSTIKLA